MATAQRILLVEDDQDQASLFHDVLAMVGYDVVISYDAEAALTYLAERDFDLLLADWDLPGVKGNILVCQAKAAYPAMKTLLYSNHADVNIAANACRADAWIRKTEGILRLREVVNGLLQRAND